MTGAAPPDVIACGRAVDAELEARLTARLDEEVRSPEAAAAFAALGIGGLMPFDATRFAALARDLDTYASSIAQPSRVR